MNKPQWALSLDKGEYNYPNVHPYITLIGYISENIQPQCILLLF